MKKKIDQMLLPMIVKYAQSLGMTYPEIKNFISDEMQSLLRMAYLQGIYDAWQAREGEK